jgi:hypothetical protein
MADAKISALPAATTPLTGTELVPIVQGGITKQVTQQNFLSGSNPTSISENGYPVVSQADIGTAPNEVPVNGMLGNMAFQDKEDVVISPAATAVPANLGDMVFQLTSNTSLTIKVKGTDGTVRSVALTLA